MRELIRSAAKVLEDSGVPRPQWTAEQLLAHRLGILPVDLVAWPRPVDPVRRAGFQADVAARASGVPLQYLMGIADFYGREFAVGPGVFIPRPETEVLVAVVLRLLEGMPRDSRVADIGTGCGAIAVTLAAEKPGLRVTATDCSGGCLAFAERNARRHGASVNLVRADLLGGQAAGSADLVVSNPPYLDPEESLNWPRELGWEPWLSLDGGEQGLSTVRRLIEQGRVVLRDGGWMALELGAGQPEEVQRIAAESGFPAGPVFRDLAGLERVLLLHKSGSRSTGRSVNGG